MKNAKGNALIIVLILIAAVMATSAVVMQNSASLGQIFARKSSSQAADNVAQLVSSLMSDPNVCLSGFDGAGSEKGLEFLDSSNAPSTFNASAAPTAEQNVTLPSNFPNSSGGRNRFEAGFAIPDSDLRILKLYVTGVENPSANKYTMRLMAQLEAVQGIAVRGMSPRLIMKIEVQTSGANVISCGAAPDENSNQSLCEGMNCTYTVSATGASNCFCPVKPVDCLNGTYVQSIVNFTPRCSSATISRSCPSPKLLVALDASGNPVCADVLSCPAGTSAVGPGGPTNPPECKCVTAGDVWDGSNCGVPPICTGGATTTLTAELAPPAGCYCSAGQTWNGALSSCVPIVIPGLCVAGADNMIDMFDGQMGDPCGQAICIARNYLSVANGGTGLFANYAPCTQAAPGDTCLSRIRFPNGTCTTSTRCEVYAATCAPAVAPTLCSPTGSQFRWSGSAWLPVGGPLPPAWDFTILNAPGYSSLSDPPDASRWGWAANFTGSIRVGGGVTQWPSNNMQHGPANTILECQPCTGGATTTASAVLATPAGCYCTAGETWNTVNLSCEPAVVRTCTAAGVEWPSQLAQGGLDNWNATWMLPADPFIEASWDLWRATWAGIGSADVASGIYLSTGSNDVRSVGGWVTPQFQLPACTSALNGAKAFTGFGNGPTGSRNQYAYQCICP